jgi:hypothetical protein
MPAIAIPQVKALVAHSPYAQEIASGEKDVEYRSWSTHYRGWLAIVAARRRESGTDAGRCVCIVRLVDVVGQEGDYRWLLSDPIPLTERWIIPGRLGLFTVDPPDFVAKLIDAQAKPAVNEASKSKIKRFRESHPGAFDTGSGSIVGW